MNVTRGMKVNCENRAMSGALGFFRCSFIVCRLILFPIPSVAKPTYRTTSLLFLFPHRGILQGRELSYHDPDDNHK